MSPHLSCGEISPHDRFYFTFLHMTWFFLYLPCGDISPTEHLSCRDTSPHDNLSHGKISPHDRFFLHQHRWWCWWQISGMGWTKCVFFFLLSRYIWNLGNHTPWELRVTVHYHLRPPFSFPPWPWEPFAHACKKNATCKRKSFKKGEKIVFLLFLNLDLNLEKLYCVALGIWKECNKKKEKFQKEGKSVFVLFVNFGLKF